MSNALISKPMHIDVLSRKLQDKRLKKVAKSTGLHYNTLRKIRDDEDANPTLNVMNTLSDYFRTH